MNWYIVLMLVVCAAVSACTPAAPVADVSGAGFVKMHMSPETRKSIVKNDQSFASEVIINNKACEVSPGCLK